jgi:hypothetical protein
MNTQTIPMTRFSVAQEDIIVSTTTTAVEDNLVLFTHPAINPAYTLVFGVVATSPPLQPRQAVKYVFSRRPASKHAQFEVPWFESSEEDIGQPGATMVSLMDWPRMCEHPERLKVAYNLAGLIAHFDGQEMEQWSSFVDSFSFFLKLHESPLQRFKELSALWKSEVRLLSDMNEICNHPAYQEIIGMGVLALPFVFAELEKSPDHWFWALKAITGHDPVPEEQRGDLTLMTKFWLSWANSCKEKLGADWTRVFLRSDS